MLKYRLIPIFWPDIDHVDTTRYNQNDTAIADTTRQNGRYCRFRYQNPTANTDAEIANHVYIKLQTRECSRLK